MFITALAPRRLGVPEGDAPLRFGSVDPSSPASERHLFLQGEPAFELSFWCGTCPFLFERKVGANTTLSADLESMTELERQIEVIDDRILDAFSPLLPAGDYLPLLLEVQPELIAPHDSRDYFTHEQVSTWGLDSFWNLPENPRSYYYRTFETAVEADEHLYEFIVPMVPPQWNTRDRVQHYRDLMQQGTAPTAVALSTLDICQPAMDGASADYYVHWGLSHFLLDGHHKVEAAARSGATLRLLSLVSLDGSLASPDAMTRLPELLSRPRVARRAEPMGPASRYRQR